VKFQLVEVTYTREMTLRVLCPVDMTGAALERLAAEEAENLDDWDLPDWDTQVGQPLAVVIPAEECRVERNDRGRMQPVPALLLRDDVVVVDDDRKTFGHPLDATWWHATEEQARLERMNEPNPQQIEMFTPPR
jgi:hypothetical protein